MLMTRRARRDARREIDKRLREHTLPEETRCRCERGSLPCFDECVRVAARNGRPFPLDRTVFDADVAIRRALLREGIEAAVLGIMAPLPPLVSARLEDVVLPVRVLDDVTVHAVSFDTVPGPLSGELRVGALAPRFCTDCSHEGHTVSLDDCTNTDHCPF